MKNRKLINSGIILIVALGLGFFNLPNTTQQKLLPFVPKAILDQKINLGLDLQGGSQLDYKIDLRKVPEKDQPKIIDGIISVINGRVNKLNVAEPNIYPSKIGNEQHVIVELAGIKDLNKAKESVGKTIQLEFKEERATQDPNHKAEVEKNANNLLNKVLTGDFALIGKEEENSNPGKIYYNEEDFQYKDQIPTELADDVFKLKVGEVSKKIYEVSNAYTVRDGQLVAQNGYNLVKLLDKKEKVEREINTPRSVKTSHILVAYKGANRADAAITRTEDEAKKLAEEIKAKIEKGEKFEDLAKQYSDDKGSKEKGGVLDSPVDGKGGYVKEYETASLGLKTANEVSAVTKSSFGFHIIKALEITEAKSEKKVEDQVKIAKIFMDSSDDPWTETALTGLQFQRADVMFNNGLTPVVEVSFNSEGAKLFEELTEKNKGKRIAIFVGGILYSAPTVNEKISGGKAAIEL